MEYDDEENDLGPLDDIISNHEYYRIFKCTFFINVYHQIMKNVVCHINKKSS